MEKLGDIVATTECIDKNDILWFLRFLHKYVDNEIAGFRIETLDVKLGRPTDEIELKIVLNQTEVSKIAIFSTNASHGSLISIYQEIFEETLNKDFMFYAKLVG